MPTDTSEFQFGPGSAWAVIQYYMGGTVPTIAQPRKFDVMQSIDITFDTTTKRLMGSNTFPRAIGISEGKVTMKINFARFNGGLFQMRFGEPAGLTTGGFLMADDEAGTIPAVSTYIVTVVNSATWTKDWGVRYGDTGEPFTAVASGPTVGQYSVASGVYTFAAADASRPVVISYEYSSTTGLTLGILSHPQGQIALTSIRYQGQYGNRQIGIYIPNAVGSSVNMPTKQGDFVIQEMQFEAFANSANQIAYLYLPAGDL